MSYPWDSSIDTFVRDKLLKLLQTPLSDIKFLSGSSETEA